MPDPHRPFDHQPRFTSRLRLSRRAAAVAGALVLLNNSVPPTPSLAAQRPVHYVALGDSVASGAGVPPVDDLWCVRSANNYPHVIARVLRPAAFTDATCSAARADRMESQLASLSRGTTLVTLTVGYNDAFSLGLERCTIVGAVTRQGAPCRTSYQRMGRDTFQEEIDATGPKTAAVLRAIRRRAPHARVLLVGYLKVIPRGRRTCRPGEMFTEGDRRYVAHAEDRLNAVLARAARSAGAVFVDMHPASTGHDVCAPDGVRWSEGLLPSRATLPFHPNLEGERAMAREVLGHL
ncbi:SGNH/GDSL hydrolase family protein [Streptomyces sp. NPDC001404]|uniref:SGNH/GDSL hydrolase family protein n=1 Tax=Streptomyces sp. NPDC001404 TaxID=3364571 RepID=UPI003676C526